MKVSELLNVHAAGAHIESRGRSIQNLVQRRLNKGPRAKENKNWKRDFDKTISHIEEEIAAIKKIMSEDDLEEEPT